MDPSIYSPFPVTFPRCLCRMQNTAVCFPAPEPSQAQAKPLQSRGLASPADEGSSETRCSFNSGSHRCLREGPVTYGARLGPADTEAVAAPPPVQPIAPLCHGRVAARCRLRTPPLAPAEKLILPRLLCDAAARRSTPALAAARCQLNPSSALSLLHRGVTESN